MASSPAHLQFGPVTLVPDERVLLKDGQPVALTPKAFDLLVFLATNPGRLLTKDEILQGVWPDAVVEESNLAYHVFAIRKALADGSDPDRYIETVPKHGYRFIPSVVRLSRNDRAIADQEQPVAGAGVALEPSPATPANGGDDGIRGRRSWRVAPWFAWVTAVAGLVIGAAGALGLFGVRPTSAPAPAPVQRFQEPLPAPAEYLFSISPDSRQLLLVIQGLDGSSGVWVRALSEPTARPLPGISGFLPGLPPPPVIWSPRSDAIAGGAGALTRVTLNGGVPQPVCDLPGLAVGGSWNRDEVLLVGNPAGPLLRCPVSGGRATPVTQPSGRSEIHLFPSFLSDRRHFIYLRIDRSAPERSGVYVGDLHASAPAGEKRLLATGFAAVHVPASDRRASALVFLRDGSLFAQRFDDERLALRGAEVRLADHVGSILDYGLVSASPDVLVYREPDPLYQLTWFDRDGRELRRVGAPEPIAGLALSPAGDRAVVAKHVPRNVADQDLWLVNLTRNENPTRLTFAPSLEFWPVWLTNERFAYGAGGGERTIYEQTIGNDKTRREWFQGFGTSGVTAADGGRLAVFLSLANPAMGMDLWVRTAHGPPGGAPLITGEGHQGQPQLSSDGRRLAYVSTETGRNEVFVAAMRVDRSTGTASVGRSVSVSDGGGFAPRWSGDGRTLFYLKVDGSVMAVDLGPTDGAVPKPAKRLFTVPGVFHEWGVVQDGRRLLLAVPTGPPPPLQIIVNWQSLLPE